MCDIPICIIVRPPCRNGASIFIRPEREWVGVGQSIAWHFYCSFFSPFRKLRWSFRVVCEGGTFCSFVFLKVNVFSMGRNWMENGCIYKALLSNTLCSVSAAQSPIRIDTLTHQWWQGTMQGAISCQGYYYSHIIHFPHDSYLLDRVSAKYKTFKTIFAPNPLVWWTAWGKTPFQNKGKSYKMLKRHARKWGEKGLTERCKHKDKDHDWGIRRNHEG